MSQNLKTIRAQLRRDIRGTQADYDRHVRREKCKTDTCDVRARYQERLATLYHVLKLCGGRVKAGKTVSTIMDWI